ncbi:MAG: ClpX C4-type zinc finger protein [Gammaproteobacteria bacterium]|nr:ClpX C4-type zinc finger protein [Gammaproteobacteria bacterium]
MSPPPRPLPDGIRFDTLRAQAKDLKSAFAAGDADAATRIEPYFSDLSASAVRLHHAQLVVAREYGVSSWRKLKGLIDARDAYGEALKTVAGIRDRMPRPSRALLDEMKAAQRKLHGERKRYQAASPEPVTRTTGPTRHCSFCNKSQYEVQKLIIGGNSRAHICDECVAICNEVLDDELRGG